MKIITAFLLAFLSLITFFPTNTQALCPGDPGCPGEFVCPGDPRCSDDLGKITPPDTVPTVAGDPTNFVAGLFRNAVSLLLIVAFAVFLIWTMIAGFRFIFAGGDEKTIGSAWSQIYWGLIGMAIILSSFAIIKLVETFFGVSIFTNFQLPQGP